MDHPTWIDDERSPLCCVPIYPRPYMNELQVSRPLWQDVLWGQERWHTLFHEDSHAETVDLENLETLENLDFLENDIRYIDYEFDSGCGSPTPSSEDVDA